MTSMARSLQEGKSAWLGGLGVEIKISSQQTGGVFSLVECTLEPGRLVPPHVHTHEDEYTYVLEGEIGLRVGDQIIQATPGCTVVKPINGGVSLPTIRKRLGHKNSPNNAALCRAGR